MITNASIEGLLQFSSSFMSHSKVVAYLTNAPIYARESGTARVTRQRRTNPAETDDTETEVSGA